MVIKHVGVFNRWLAESQRFIGFRLYASGVGDMSDLYVYDMLNRYVYQYFPGRLLSFRYCSSQSNIRERAFTAMRAPNV